MIFFPLSFRMSAIVTFYPRNGSLPAGNFVQKTLDTKRGDC